MVNNPLISPLFPGGNVASGGWAPQIPICQEYYVKEENPYTGEMTAKEIKVSTWWLVLGGYISHLQLD